MPALACFVLLSGAIAAEKPQVPITATVVRESATDVAVLWRFEPTAGWHLYADLLNDTGFPPSLTWELPEGWKTGPLQWPVPERSVTVGEILDHVYEGEFIVIQGLTVPRDELAGGTVTIAARWDWLACRDLCVPGKTEAQVVFTTGEPSAAQTAALAAARAALPAPAPAGLQIAWSEAEVTFTVSGAVRLEFYPAADCVRLVDLIADGAAEGDRLRLRLRPDPEKPGPVRGILHVKLSDGSVRNWTVDIPYGG